MSTLETQEHGFRAAPASDEPAEGAVFVRPSAHSTWMMCQMAVSQTSDPRFDNTSTMQAARGTGVHLFNELHIQGTPVTHEGQALNLWLAEMTARDEDITGLAPQSTLKAIVSDMLLAHHKWVEQFWLPVGQHLEMLSAEQKMRMPLGVLPNGREVWLRGTSDFITLGKIWDWKTSTSGWTAKKMDEMTQHLFYAALAEYTLGIPLPGEATYVVYDFKRGTWSWSEFSARIQREQVDRALFEMYKMGAVLDADAAMASPAKKGASWGQDGRGWWCSAKWCGAWDFCDGKYILDDGKASGRRDNTITWR